MAETGWVSIAMAAFRKSLANSSNFQTLVGEVDEAGALNHIYVDGFPGPTGGRFTLTELQTGYRPFALLSVNQPGYRSEQEATDGDSFKYDIMLSVHCRIERDMDVAEADDPDTAFFTVGNIWGGILGDLEANTGTAGYANIVSMRSPPWVRTHRAEGSGTGDVTIIEIMAELE